MGGSTPPSGAARFLAALRPASAAHETAGGRPDLSSAGIGERLERARRDRMAAARQGRGDSPELRDLVNPVVGNGRTALTRLASDGEQADIGHPRLNAALEVIVREDGSRPAFQVV